MSHNSPSRHQTLVIGHILMSEREDARSARILRHWSSDALVTRPGPGSLVDEVECLLDTPHMRQIE